MTRVLVTGGAGFIGSNFVRWMIHRFPEIEILNFDKLTYAGNLENLRDLEKNPRYRFLQGDVADPQAVAQALRGCESVFHFAAESHVDRSIQDAADFLRTNVLGTYVLLEAVRQSGVRKFVHISTDEVYGSLEQGMAQEDSPIRPNSPYAASKAAADHLARAYHVTYGLPVLVVRGSNNYGPYQFPEKFLPLLITRALNGESLPIYGDGKYQREWLYVEDFCEGVQKVWEKGQPGEAYNLGSGEHRVNLDVARLILTLLGKPQSLIQHVQDRPGHDRRYAVDSTKIRALGWSPRRRFEEGLNETIEWYRSMEQWWRPSRCL